MSTEAYYLKDLGKELVEIAKRVEATTQSPEDSFDAGRRFAFYEVLSLMKQQAVAFELTDAQIGLEGVDIESFLK